MGHYIISSYCICPGAGRHGVHSGPYFSHAKNPNKFNMIHAHTCAVFLVDSLNYFKLFFFGVPKTHLHFV